VRRFVNSGVVAGIRPCAFGVPVWAQINVGSLRGVVTDPQGGLVVGAQVKVTETATQVVHTAVTDSQGVYTAPSLPVGNYDLSVTMAGFETYAYQGTPLASGENRDLDVKLTVGAVSTHVEVTAATAPDLETPEGTYSEGEDTRTLEQLPLEINGARRDATAYMTALPGFQNGNGFQNQVNGSISGYNETYMDGTPEQINAAGHGLTRNFFSAEAVGEIKVVTTPRTDLGNAGGIATAFTTESGTKFDPWFRLRFHEKHRTGRYLRPVQALSVVRIPAVSVPGKCRQTGEPFR
jgi:Carboxypeptidase regulatory-like domain